MEVRYDKTALQEYINQVGDIGKQMRRRQDESLNVFNSCKQQYNRIYTKLEEAAHRAYNQLENAESMQRSAELEYETARRTAENAEDEEENNAAMQLMRQAQIMQAAAEEEYSRATVTYSKASGDLKNLCELWDGNAPALESQAHLVEDGMVSFSRLVANGNSDLGEYMSIMDKAQSVLYEDSTGETSGFVTGTSSSANLTGHTGTQDSGRGNDGQKTASSSFRSNLGNTIGIVAAANGEKNISMSINGKTQIFPTTKSGIAKAHRSAVSSGDAELASYTNEMFFRAGLSSNISTKQVKRYVSNELTGVDWSSTMNTPQEIKLLEEMEENEEIDVVHVDKSLVEPSLGKKRLPRDKTGYFKGERGNSQFFPHSPSAQAELKKYGMNSINYINGDPDFSPFCIQKTPWGVFNFSAEIGHMNAARHNYKADGFIVKGNYEQAEEAFCRMINAKQKGKQITHIEFRKWYQTNRLTIHECPNGYGVMLIPSVIHDACRHDGGVKNKKFESAMGNMELYDGIE